MIYTLAVRCVPGHFSIHSDFQPFCVVGHTASDLRAIELCKEFNDIWLPKALKIRNDIFDSHSWKTINQMLELEKEALSNSLPPFTMSSILSCANEGSKCHYYSSYHLP